MLKKYLHYLPIELDYFKLVEIAKNWIWIILIATELKLIVNFDLTILLAKI